MKALVLAGGKGSRLRDHAASPPKPLMQVGDKRLMDFSLQNAVASSVDEIVIVVSAFTEGVINPLRLLLPWRADHLQDPERARRVSSMRSSAPPVRLGDSDFVLMLADEIVIDASLAAMIDRFRRETLFAILGVVTVQDARRSARPTRFSRTASPGRSIGLIEKPRRPHNDVMGTGHCIFRSAILGYIDMCPINQTRGEKELPDLIQCAIRRRASRQNPSRRIAIHQRQRVRGFSRGVRPACQLRNPSLARRDARSSSFPPTTRQIRSRRSSAARCHSLPFSWSMTDPAIGRASSRPR
jgi:NDP-sugar pyrophosphorylase family protein